MPCASCAADALRKARSAVLDDDTMLERILSAGALRVADVASAALVCRAWCRVAASDAVWRPVWRREAPSLRALEPSLARSPGGGGAGFRAAVAQLRGSALLARAQAWTLDDFSVAVDITWRGRPLLAALQPLTALDYGDAEHTGEVLLTLPNALPQEDTVAVLCVRHLWTALAVKQDDGTVDVDHDTLNRAAKEHLRLRLLLVRSDGALACLVDRDAGDVHQIGYDDDPTNVEVILGWRRWQGAQKSGGDGTPLLTVLDDDVAAPVSWWLTMDSGLGTRADEEDRGLCRECNLYFSCCGRRPNGDDEAPSREALLFTLAHMMRWVTPRAAAAQAADAAAREVHLREREAAAAAAAAAAATTGTLA
jgi:hypothetical protein